MLKKFMAVATLLLLPITLHASDEDRVASLCEQKIGDLYGLERFRNVWAERTGHHQWQVHGKVKYQHNTYPFNCKIKEGRVRSWSYDGPSPRHGKDNHEARNAAIAVGAGIAIAAIIESSHKDPKSEHQRSKIEISETILEDNCQEELRYRIRDEHNNTARVRMQSAQVQGHDLSGEAKVVYEGHHPHHANYTCHFDKRGHVIDSDYQLF